MSGISMFRKEGWVVIAAVFVSVLFIVTAVNASSTISTNISTGGTLSVTGASTLTGLTTHVAGLVSQASSTVVGAFTVTGKSSLAAASTTMLSNIQTANTATTTAYLGCVQTYGTTTNQAIRLVFYATSTVNGVTTSSGVATVQGGYVLFEF